MGNHANFAGLRNRSARKYGILWQNARARCVRMSTEIAEVAQIMRKVTTRDLLVTNETLRIALEESLKLQSHYAELLNMHDGGQRVSFHSVEAWLERLKETRTV